MYCTYISQILSDLDARTCVFSINLDVKTVSRMSFHVQLFTCHFIFQDGRIDYNEFVAMMQKDNSEFGKKGHQGKGFSNGFREASPVC